jgi:hypothetical protein
VVPAEALEEHTGPAITYDDVLDFALRLESLVTPVPALHLLRPGLGSGGLNGRLPAAG